jgi:hypothetical protein
MKKSIVGLILLASCAAPNDDERVGAPAGGGPETTAEQAQALETFGACAPGQATCCVAPQTFNFNDFPGSPLNGGYDHIISPRSIEIGRVQGNCDDARRTDYFSLLGRVNPPKFPQCVAVEFGPLDFLMTTIDGGLTIVRSNEIVVKKAGCR